jgi:DNA-binding MltR family transcriptional regulator
VLLATSLIDEFLKFVLISGFRADAASKRLMETVFSGNGPLATFSAKISVCSALGLVGGQDVRHDLTLLRKIRNDFAHAYTERKLSDFAQCASLRIAASLDIQDADSMRKKFKYSCAGIIPHLALSALVNIAKDRFINANQEGLQAEYKTMISAVFDGTEFPD